MTMHSMIRTSMQVEFWGLLLMTLVEYSRSSSHMPSRVLARGFWCMLTVALGSTILMTMTML